MARVVVKVVDDGGRHWKYTHDCETAVELVDALQQHTGASSDRIEYIYIEEGE